MGQVRINELAREREVKSKRILALLPELGATEQKSHSSSIEDDVADKVRAYVKAVGLAEQEAGRPAALAQAAAAPEAAARAPAPAPAPGRGRAAARPGRPRAPAAPPARRPPPACVPAPFPARPGRPRW